MNPDPSVINYLNSKGLDSSPQGRANLFEQHGLGKSQDYLDSYNATVAGKGDNSAMNLSLLDKLRGPNQLIVTSKNYQNGLNDASGGLDTSLRGMNPNYPYPPAPVETKDASKTPSGDFSDGFTRQLDAIGERSNESTKALIASIHAARQNQQGQVDQKYEQYTRGLQLLGIEKGSAQATPELLSGQLIQAENDHQQKISKLVSDETKALIDAQTARDEGDLKLMKEKMDYVKDIKKEKATALKDYYDTLTAGSKAAEGLASSVLDKVDGLDPKHKEEYIMRVADAYNIPYDTLVSSLAKEKVSRTKDDLSAANIRSEIANRGKSGGGTAAERKAFVFDQIGQLLEPGAKDSKGVPYLDSSGYMTAAGFKKLISAAKGDGITRKEFLAEYAGQIYLGTPEAASAYGLTGAEVKAIKGI